MPACAPQELHKLLLEERLAGATLLILANKQDIAGALPAGEIQKVRGGAGAQQGGAALCVCRGCIGSLLWSACRLGGGDASQLEDLACCREMGAVRSAAYRHPAASTTSPLEPSDVAPSRTPTHCLLARRCCAWLTSAAGTGASWGAAR